MHHNSYQAMAKCVQKYLTDDFVANGAVTVIDIGSYDVNGSYKPLFSDRSRFNYLGVDLSPGPNVDIIANDPYKLPLRDEFAEVVISGQMLEHCEFFWSAFQEMVRIVKPGGFIFLIAPGDGPYHAFPVDCYRFLRDAYPALAKWAGCDCVETWQEEDSDWKDMVGIFQRSRPQSG